MTILLKSVAALSNSLLQYLHTGSAAVLAARFPTHLGDRRLSIAARDFVPDLFADAVVQLTKLVLQKPRTEQEAATPELALRLLSSSCIQHWSKCSLRQQLSIRIVLEQLRPHEGGALPGMGVAMQQACAEVDAGNVDGAREQLAAFVGSAALTCTTLSSEVVQVPLRAVVPDAAQILIDLVVGDSAIEAVGGGFPLPTKVWGGASASASVSASASGSPRGTHALRLVPYYRALAAVAALWNMRLRQVAEMADAVEKAQRGQECPVFKDKRGQARRVKGRRR